ARLAGRRDRTRSAGAPRQPRLVVIVDAEKLPLHDLDFRSHGVGLADLAIHLVHLVAGDADAPPQVDQRVRVDATGGRIERGESEQAFQPDDVPVSLALMLARQLAAYAPQPVETGRAETRWLPALRDLSPAADEDTLWRQSLA